MGVSNCYIYMYRRWVDGGEAKNMHISRQNNQTEGKDLKLTQFPSGYFSGFTPLPSNKIVAPSSSALAINSSILLLLSGEITGPKSAPSSNPPSILIPLALSAISGTQSFVSPIITNVLSAIHLCPAAPNAAPAMALSA